MALFLKRWALNRHNKNRLDNSFQLTRLLTSSTVEKDTYTLALFSYAKKVLLRPGTFFLIRILVGSSECFPRGETLLRGFLALSLKQSRLSNFPLYGENNKVRAANRDSGSQKSALSAGISWVCGHFHRCKV